MKKFDTLNEAKEALADLLNSFVLSGFGICCYLVPKKENKEPILFHPNKDEELYFMIDALTTEGYKKIEEEARKRLGDKIVDDFIKEQESSPPSSC